TGQSLRGKNYGVAYIHNVTALCAYSKPINIFESGAKRHFQKYLCTTQSLNRLYSNIVSIDPC
ncbi:MAG: hypothetical protein ACKPCM_10590, partial [Pseudanabaena sp.]